MNAPWHTQQGETAVIDRYASAATLAHHSRSSPSVCELIYRAVGGRAEGVRDLRSASQNSRDIRARQAVVWAARTKLGASFHEIGRALNRDHSTILYSFRVATRLIETDEEFGAMCRRILG